jgi:hypothetical protein
LGHDTFAMPGCYGRGGRRFRGMHDSHTEANTMYGRGRGMGAGGGKGQGQGGQRTRADGRPTGGRTRRQLYLPAVRADGTTRTRCALRRAQMPQVWSVHDKAITDYLQERNENAKRRSNRTHGNGRNDRTRGRILRWIWGAGVRELRPRAWLWDGFF